ncbi:hypothetical protein PV721_24860 [Streptomyces sp. MB09-01]|uniref:hypothetical protein n=1 Tax=Streptomyces sp. MB09-01 TaxID=3028666 RepID=UPI0029A1795D|nr:hypothetical protein [Streptomyces sp. MB09-01]MDX3537543.1 hypothetical protein [Streptomyces sp. MB09-01]
MTSADAPSPWTGEDLNRLHRVAVRALQRHVSPAPGAEGAAGGAGRPVRGVVQPPECPDTTRVVLWDGRDLDSSVAYDLPLVDASYDCNVPWSVIAAVLRQLAAAGPDPAAARATDGLGIPVVDARAATRRFLEEPAYDLTDALHAAVSMIGYYGEDPDPEPELLLAGFLLVAPATVRLYVDRTAGAASAAGPAGRIGVDIALRDEEGAVRGGFTGTMAALPSLVRDELDWNTSEAEDPYCTGVYDFTSW